MYNNGEIRAHVAGNELGSLISQQLQGRAGLMSAASTGDPGRERPMMEVEYDQLVQATIELDQSVSWLLQRIQPICHPCTAVKATEGPSCREPDAPASELRTKLQNMRGIVEGISKRIAEVRFSIEI